MSDRLIDWFGALAVALVLLYAALGAARLQGSGEALTSVKESTVLSRGSPLCFYGMTPAKDACNSFGGYRRVSWEFYCVQSPTCYTMPEDWNL